MLLFRLQRARPITGMCLCFRVFLPYYASNACASKVTEIGRISVVMYVSDQFVYGKLQLTSGASNPMGQGDTSPQYLDWGDIITNVPTNISRVISATFYPCNIFLIS